MSVADVERERLLLRVTPPRAARADRNGVGSRAEFVAMLAEERRRRIPLAEWWGRVRQREREQATCPGCGRNVYEAGRNIYCATYCSNACKQRAYRKRRALRETVTSPSSVTAEGD